jgi:outer membrane protein assembly factor BamE
MRNAILLLALVCAACSNYSANLPSIKPYRMDVQQGNVVTSKMMLQLRPGMTKSQVRFIMGTPLIADSFHANRWDYIYRMQKDGKVVEQRHVILEFEDDQLKRVRGDVIPAGTDGAAAGSEAKPSGKSGPVTIKSAPAPGAAKEKEKGMLDKLKFWKSDEPKEAPKPEVQPAPASKAESGPAPAPVVVEPKPEPKSEPEVKSEPKAVPAPQEEEKGMLDKLKFWKSDEPQAAPKPEAPPVSAPATKVEPKPEPSPEPKAEAKPVEKTIEPAPMELKPLPKPEVDLPPEEDPGYFEKMLEKIGF